MEFFGKETDQTSDLVWEERQSTAILYRISRNFVLVLFIRLVNNRRRAVPIPTALAEANSMCATGPQLQLLLLLLFTLPPTARGLFCPNWRARFYAKAPLREIG